ncbi:MAG: hypothetical protein DA408_15670 [Bacteroidetes bacterium]|nr:MAG: hypothetical protein C7N36_05500 [Bacteroidota bacterium]PTM10605.1 MAG: hypothetical protein DA408_15670 [Bacteroidota bacterium]
MLIREATDRDNKALLQLTRLNPMKGVISLCIDRQPDFFALLKKRGESIVLVAVKNEQLTGVLSASKHLVWFNKKPVPVYYIADFKVHPAFRGSTTGLRLAKNMYEMIREKGAGLVFCTIADGNDRILPFFKGRLGLPVFKTVGKFRVLQIIPSPVRPQVPFSVEDRTGSSPDFPLKSFYHQFFQKYQLGPVVEEEDLADCRHLIMVENGSIKAAISLMDTSHLKQHVVVGLPSYLKVVSTISRWAAKILPVRPFPKIGQPILMWNIRYFGYLDGYEDALFKLIKVARRLAWEQKIRFLSIGLHERDPLLHRFKKIPHIPFSSHGMLATFNQKPNQVDEVAAGIPFEDFALV